MQKNPLFVLGIWRSGTSLLYAMLNQHPDIKLLYESDLPLLWPLFLSPARSSWAERVDFWNGALRRHRIDPQMLPASVDLGTAFESMARQYAESRGARIWGCKSPNYYNMVPRLAQEFPNARYIFLWREPKEICASVTRAARNSFWFSRRGMLRRVLFGCEMLRRACERLQDSGRPVHELYYSDLVEHPERELHQICRFLGIPFVSAMTTLEGADLSAVFNGDHHNILKNSDEARRQSNPPGEDASNSLYQKIERYHGVWHSRFPNWRLACGQQTPLTPGRWEECVDRLTFRALCAADQFRRWLFAFLPLSCWRTYRRLRYEDEDRYIQSPALIEAIVGPRCTVSASPHRVSKLRD